jgi:hypothetical protein
MRKMRCIYLFVAALIASFAYQVRLGDGTMISGQDIDANIVWWLTHNMPEV